MNKLNLTDESKSGSQVIHVDFRRNRPFIDFDHYLDHVTEIHCRCCKHRRPRKGSQQLMETWGYVCKACLEENGGHNSTSNKEGVSINHNSILIA